MNKNSTTNDLLLYLFNETQMAESVLIQHAIDYDTETEQEFEELKATLSLLDEMLESPSEESVNRILAYSKTTAVLV